ncbi:LysM peptidoglycan-binding domain-containing protein [Bacillus chungangensis]|uniref:LysM repeat protein n=1 Tax=Bacillus chungangensis TaxID=587633 RepID=A0ABT9WNX7_9BACI|nr:LysM peptidoglycan-binding domain-containing protein [Bacillus chungangensis]MDQ0174814.1 LysM repeat protein [Bacillus chungangensis]
MKRSPSENQEEFTHRQLDKEDTKEASTKKSLPSRSEIHQHKRKQEQLRRRRTKNPLLQVLLLFFLLLPIVAYSFYSNYMNRDRAKGEETKANEEVTVMEENNIAKKPEAKDESIKDSEDEQKEESQEEKEPSSKENSTTPPPVQQPPAVKESEPVKEEVPKQQPEQKPVQPQQEQKTENKQEGKTTTHTVQQGETLFRISMKYYNSQAGIEKIRQANGISGNDIKVGQVLKIPLP